MPGSFPIISRELLLAARRSGTYWTRFCMAALIGGILFSMALSIRQSPAQVSHLIFLILQMIMFGYCLLAGVRYTADALSAERRQGTLGLLFLTDLKGADVVVGKMVIHSLNAFFALLAAIPLLAVPVLLGGVTGAEVWRISLVFINTLFFSLAIGLVVSAFGLQERSVVLGSLCSILALSFGLPLIWQGLNRFTDARWLEVLCLWPSPAYAFKIVASGLFVPARSDFWPAMVTVTGIAVVCMATASWWLPRQLEPASPEVPAESRSSRKEGRKVAGAFRAAQKRHWMEKQPYYWRVARDEMMGHWNVILTVAAAGFSLYAVSYLAGHRRPGPPKAIILFGWLALHWVLKLLWTVETCRPLNEDKRVGALELILCTPLPAAEMTRAQRRRVWQIFALPIAAVGLGNFTCWIFAVDDVLRTLFFLGLLTLPSDLWALSWAGLHLSLVNGSLTRATASALGRVLVPPWVVGFAMVLGLAAINAPETMIRQFLAFWGVGVVAYDLCLVSWNSQVLSTGFRRIAAGDLAPTPGQA